MLTKLANILTLSRIAVIPLVVGLFYVETNWSCWAAFGLYAAACVTDYMDGYVARNWAQESAIGRFLDPIADKLLVSAVLVLLVAFQHITGAAVFARHCHHAARGGGFGPSGVFGSGQCRRAGQPAGQMENPAFRCWRWAF